MLSAFLQSSIIVKYLLGELEKGKTASPPSLPTLYISQFGVILKTHHPGKWQLILDLSFLIGESITKGIFQCIKMDDIINCIMNYGQGTPMAKFNVECAYQNFAVHPDDKFLSEHSGV